MWLLSVFTPTALSSILNLQFCGRKYFWGGNIVGVRKITGLAGAMWHVVITLGDHRRTEFRLLSLVDLRLILVSFTIFIERNNKLVVRYSESNSTKRYKIIIIGKEREELPTVIEMQGGFI